MILCECNGKKIAVEKYTLSGGESFNVELCEECGKRYFGKYTNRITTDEFILKLKRVEMITNNVTK